MGKKSGRPEQYSRTWNYEVTLYRGDEIIDSGTIKEIAERRGVRKDTIRWYLTGAGLRRADARKDQSRSIRAVRIG
jgi:hypothetical protein